MEKTKVCHLTSAHHPYDVRIFHKECRSLAEAGYDVTIIAPHANDEITDDITIKAVGKYPTRLKRFLKTVLEVHAKAVDQKAALYHFHDPDLLPVSLALKLRGAKVIYDVHEDVPRQIMSKHWIPRPARKTISIATEIFEDIIAANLDAVITATPYIQERFRKLNKNSFNINNYPKLEELYDANSHDPTKEPVICYAGALSPERGLSQMISAIEITRARLLIAGPVSGLGADCATEKVHFLGMLARPQLRELFAKSMAGIVVFHPEPNHVNAQPNKLFEYMSAGLPVIASAFPKWREIIDTTKCGICVDPLNPKEIAAAVEWIISNPGEAEVMGMRGREAVEKLYNWDREKEKLRQVYEGICGRGNYPFSE